MCTPSPPCIHGVVYTTQVGSRDGPLSSRAGRGRSIGKDSVRQPGRPDQALPLEREGQPTRTVSPGPDRLVLGIACAETSDLGRRNEASAAVEMRVGGVLHAKKAMGMPGKAHARRKVVRTHTSKAPRWGSVSTDQDIDLDEPFAYVSDLMTELEVVSVRVDCSLQKAASLFDTKRISGMPVVDEQGVCVGVLSKKDLPGDPYERQRLFDSGEKIADYFTSPAICVRGHAHVVEAAAIMLKHKVHRLPVVDKDGKPVGVISRSDVFKPLLNEKAALFNAAVVPEAQATQRNKVPEKEPVEGSAKQENGTGENSEETGYTVVTQGSDWEVKYLYDGDCSICMNLVSMLKKRDKGRGKIKFINIADVDYNPDENMYIEFEEAMQTIHVITKDQEIIKGAEALGVMYDAVGLGWVSTLQKVPGLQQLGSAAYELIAKLRLPIEGRSMDALLATRQIEKAASGKAGCVNPDDPCRNLYDDDGDEALSSYEEFY